MGKGSSSPGPSAPVTTGLQNDENALVGIASQQAQNAQQLYNTAEPGFQTAEAFYSALASGDPGAISRAIAPEAQQINQEKTGAQKNILATAPAGGEKNLALEMADVNAGSEVGKAAGGAYTGSFNALGALAGQGVGESTASAGAATSAYSAGGTQLSSLGNLQIEGQQLQMEQKGQELGAFSSLASTGAELGTAGILGGAGGGVDYAAVLAGIAL